MARTRTEIEALAVLNTGRSDKDTLMNSLCDSALKVAVAKHPFEDCVELCDDVTITEDATTVDISGLEVSSSAITFDIYDTITARIVEADGSRNSLLMLKNRQWWDKNIINPEDNQKGWPQFGHQVGTTMNLDAPATNGLELRLRVATIPVFAADGTECPIKVLDLFVEQYVTAMTYMSLGMMDKYLFWYRLALGPRYEVGDVGGTLLQAINSDKSHTAEVKSMERGDAFIKNKGISVQNLITGAPNYGNTVGWY